MVRIKVASAQVGPIVPGERPDGGRDREEAGNER